MMAYCGLTCTECPAYLATQSNDDQKRKEVAEMWSREFKADIKPDHINCDGCLSESKRLFAHCTVCEIRKCSRERGFENCGHCGDFACEKVSFVINAVPEAKAALEEIRKKL